MNRRSGLPICALIAVVLAGVTYSQELGCDSGRGWEYLGRNKCYKVFYGDDVRAWDRARDICKSEGSRLVNIKDQYENYAVGTLVEGKVGHSESYWIGLYNKYDDCTSCPALTWQGGGGRITQNQAFWYDEQPDDDSNKDCVYARRNEEDYIYDRPFIWSFDKCVWFRPFVCEKMAVPADCFPCFTEGFVRQEDVCNGVGDCPDASDELNCPSRAHHFHSGVFGDLTRVVYDNAMLYTWAIQSPVGSNVILEFRSFNTEPVADPVTVYGGNFIETMATQLAVISGNRGNLKFRSPNNKMLVKYTTDSAQLGPGFSASWTSMKANTSAYLTARTNQQSYAVDRVNVGGIQSFLSLRDYIIIIRSEDQRDEAIITIEITDMVLQDGDKVYFYNGDSPNGEVLAEMCNQGCQNEKFVYSTGSAISIILRTGRDVTDSVNFAFRYRQGCYLATADQWGVVFSPGFTAGVNYPNDVSCRWEIMPEVPMALYFDRNTQIQDQAFNRTNNGDYVKIFDNGVALHLDSKGFTSVQLRDQTILAPEGKVVIEFITSPTRSDLGFKATWSIDCEPPNYDANTIMTTGRELYHYTAKIDVQCATGYDFLQSQIPQTTSQIELECGYQGKWLRYNPIPRCSPVYCGAVPNIDNGYIKYATGSVYGSVAEYECYPGSQTASSTVSANITCNRDGFWSSSPRCQAANCPFSSANLNILNGQGELVYKDGFEIGSILKYTCDSGYQLVGEPILFCQARTGQYTAPVPSCEQLTCLLPEVENQVAWLPRLITYNSQATLRCNTGYTVSNSSLNPITCKADRTITQMPSCVDVKECDTLRPCSHLCTEIPGSFVCSCPPGYYLGPGSRNCLDIFECSSPNLHMCDGSCQELEGSYECSCSPPYTLFTGSGTSGLQIPAMETGLLPTDTYHINHTCVLIQCPMPDATIVNGVLLTEQSQFHVGDFIEYQCNLGFQPRRSTLQCDNNGMWSGTVPTCQAVTCGADFVPGGVENIAVYDNSAQAYLARLYLNCTVADQTFSNYRHCTYNPATDTYEMQGSSYECGYVDCGTPESVPGSVNNVLGTRYGNSFTFQCTDRLSGSSQAGDQTVRCLADGNWDFGSLTCEGLACEDPGFPPGGDIVANSLKDLQQVNFKCNRAGFNLSHHNPLTCSGSSFGTFPRVPECQDVEPPTFQNCEQLQSQTIELNRYSILSRRLPSMTLTDNVGIESYTISPGDANSTLYLSQDETIVYTARDYAGNVATCQLNAVVRDETPPTVTCPQIEVVPLSTEADEWTNTVQAVGLVATDNKEVLQRVLLVDGLSRLPDQLTAADLWNTYTYTGQVTDTSSNVATCRSQIFVRPAGCSNLSFRKPLNGQVIFSSPPQGLPTVDVTCDTDYTLLSGKSDIFTCQNGIWSGTVPACVKDVTKPEITCPSSTTLRLRNDPIDVDFTLLNVDRTDNNDMNPPDFSPESKSFTEADLYTSTEVVVTVSDIANNVASCSFQYTLLPDSCSVYSAPVTLHALPNDCSQTPTGYQCTVECNDGYVLRGYGKSRVITCTTGSDWSEVFPACIRDETPPLLTCPASRSLYITDFDDSRTINFNDPLEVAFKDYTTSDNSGVEPIVTYNPSLIRINKDYLNVARPVTVYAADANNNVAACQFEIVVIADVCSPLSIANPGNGSRTCTSDGNAGWQCTITCNSGYMFYNTMDAQITSSCTPGNTFSTYVPGCVQIQDAVLKEFVGDLTYVYEPADATGNISESCKSYYVAQQEGRSSEMAGRFKDNCQTLYRSYDVTIAFKLSTFEATIEQDQNGNFRVLKIHSTYNISNNNNQNTSEVYKFCSELYGDTVGRRSADYTFRLYIDTDGSFCPRVEWQSAVQTSTGIQCTIPRFESPADQNYCMRCPSGSQSDGSVCTICAVGEYFDGERCLTCPGSSTTYYPGQTSINSCVSPCPPGSVSDTGYGPCWRCAKGSYSSNTRTCTSCGSGQSTENWGALDSSYCQPESTTIPQEACPQGTQTDGSNCVLCPSGTYGIQTSTVCQTCPTGRPFSYVEGGTSDQVCQVPCGNGFISEKGQAPCTQCPRGTRWYNSTYCEPCLSGYSTEGTGSFQCVQVTELRVKCPAGMTRNAATGVCQQCPIGTYSNREEGTCLDCGQGMSTYFTGATSFDMCFATCAAGFYSTTGLSSCEPCGVGRYWVSSTECTACPNAGTTMTNAAKSILECYGNIHTQHHLTLSLPKSPELVTENSEVPAQIPPLQEPCPAGQFSFNGYDYNNQACRPCPSNHYQPSPQSQNCIRCQDNLYSMAEGATSSDTCIAASDLCLNSRCQNGGTCLPQWNTYICQCPQGYFGRHCQTAVEPCYTKPCYNGGLCTRDDNQPKGYTCSCPTGTQGDQCETIIKTCVTTGDKTCKNGGDCINYPNSFKCLCRDGFDGPTCSNVTNICETNPCDLTGMQQCIDVSGGLNMRRKCVCKAGYRGERCEINIRECDSSPCINGGSCEDRINDFRCNCPGGYSGRYCEIRSNRCGSISTCNSPNSMCVDDHNIDDYRCICEPGYSFGVYTEYELSLNMGPDGLTPSNTYPSYSIHDCRAACDQSAGCGFMVYVPSQNECNIYSGAAPGLISVNGHNTYVKMQSNPAGDFWTAPFSLDNAADNSDEERLTTLNDQYGLNICGGSAPLDAKCCVKGTDNCNIPIGMTCSATQGSVCIGSFSFPCEDYEVRFKCAAHRVFSSNTCSLKRDYCSSNPCENGGRCEEVAGQGYRCVCVYGYAGLSCQTNIDDCAANPCMHEGTCEDGVGRYDCTCDGYEGTNCERPIDYCTRNSVNCGSHGQCRNSRYEAYCECNTGYTGTLCDTIIDLCASDPCIHGGICTPFANAYSCACVNGYYGTNCENIVDNCQGESTCLGTCRNIFNAHYCDCPANTYGEKCQNQPDPCGNYNKCQHSGQCSLDANSDMTCACPPRYEGDGCEILKDLCGNDNACQNGAECLITTTGYQCICKPGYNGINCQNDINECASNPCTGGAQCFNDINRYFCICPLTMTGDDCSRTFDPNYDLFFRHPQAYAWIPYFITVDQMNALTVSLWVRFSEPDDQGVFATQFIGSDLRTADKFLEFHESGVRVYVQDGVSDHISLQLEDQVKLNDGNWHLVHFFYDTVQGRVKLYVDSIGNVERQNNNLVNPNYSFKMWAVLGCEFDQAAQRCTGQDSFHGYLSQVTWYKRELTFRSVGSTQGEIPYQWSHPQELLLPTSEIIAVWNGYILESGVDRMSSEASGAFCDTPGRNPPCSFYQDTAMPYATGCPDDITVTASRADRIVSVRWNEPTFHNLNNGGVNKNYASGATFSWGVSHVKYIATSPQGRKAFCYFDIYVQTDEPCHEPENPFSGTQQCTATDPVGWKGCRISCRNSPSQNYVIDRSYPDIFTCGHSGEWNTDKPRRKFRYPSCGAVLGVPKADTHIRVVYQVTTEACGPTTQRLVLRIRGVFMDLRSEFNGVLCQTADCSDVAVTSNCLKDPSSTGGFIYLNLVNIELKGSDASVVYDGEETSVADFLKYHLLARDLFNFPSIPDANVEEGSVYISATPVCPMGQVVLHGQCVECGPGNYYRYTDNTNSTAICDDCPIGYYESQAGKMFNCQKCPNGQTTEMTGNYELTACKKICNPGNYFDNTAADCLPCPIGFYQSMLGQFYCEPCKAGFTTKFEESTSEDQCKATCESGFEISANDCKACPIGTYRDATVDRTCVPCPQGVITANEASTSSADCNVAACLEGTYYIQATNSCVNCQYGWYQDEKYQTSCKQCMDANGNTQNYSTPNMGTTDKQECFFYCGSGYEVRVEGVCDICPIGEWKDANIDLRSTCTSCPPDFRTPTTGSTSDSDCSIFKCPVGYEANALNTGCDHCNLGFYQDVPYSVDCKQCPPDTSTRFVASNKSTDCETYCESGYEKQFDGSCQACSQGRYKDNALGLFSSCIACDAIWTTSGTASTSAAACTIRTCPAGTRRTVDSCIGCELDTYQPLQYQDFCSPCPINQGTRQVNSTSVNQCEEYCGSGYEKVNGACVECPRGEYKNNVEGKFGECTLCPIDKITPTTATTSAAGCTIGNCTAGYFTNANNECEPCAKGSYQDQWWTKECIPCGEDKTTEFEAASDVSLCILECQPGEEDAGGFCQSCPRGYWKSLSAATSCKPCNTGKTTPGIGSISPLNCTLPACLEGTYLKMTPVPSCQPCPYDTYQDETWMESCKTCLGGRVTQNMASKSESECIANCSSGTEFNAATGGCDFCNIGEYRNQNVRSQTECQLCPIAFITGRRNAFDVSDCIVANCTEPGTYRDTVSESCKVCPLDTYNSEKWRTECAHCIPNFGTRDVASTTRDDCIRICDPGTYRTPSETCINCPRGTYKSDKRQEDCTQCPNGLQTQNPGQTSIASCVISPCVAGQGYTNTTQTCYFCPEGFYQPADGQFNCIQCPYSIKYTPRLGATSEEECKSQCTTGEEFDTASKSCKPCRPGYYQPQDEEFTCLKCPDDRQFTTAPGATSIDQCYSPCGNSLINDCSENATCTSDLTEPSGYSCSCLNNFDDIGNKQGRACMHKCDRGYCQNGAAECMRDATPPTCKCTQWYEGNRCQQRIRAEELSDDPLDIIIPVCIGVGGLLLLLTALAVCLLCWRHKKASKPPMDYSNFQGQDRMDKVSLHSYGQQNLYNGGGSMIMLAPAMAPGPEIFYDNTQYRGASVWSYAPVSKDNAVYQA